MAPRTRSVDGVDAPLESEPGVSHDTTPFRYVVTYPTGVSVTEDPESTVPKKFAQGEYLSPGAAALHAVMLLRAGMVSALPAKQ